MTSYLQSRVVLVVGGGDELHRGVAIAVARSGADVAIGGSPQELSEEAALHSIANEVWALGRRSTVAKLPASQQSTDYADALAAVISELGRLDLVLRCEPVRHT